MANLFFPQLTSGALAQYPVKKTKQIRTIQNVLPDGQIISFLDSSASTISWQLAYSELSAADLAAIQAHFAACAGSLRAFTFIDPTDNMLVASSDLTQPPWSNPGNARIVGGHVDPNRGSAAYEITNIGQANQIISQTLTVPANYQYCFSVYVSALEPSLVTLIVNGASDSASQTFATGQGWSRIVFRTKLNDPGTTLTVGLQLGAGQQVEVYGPQLEGQITPSRYRATTVTSGLYSNAHWASDELAIVADAPNSFSASFNIESVV